MQIDLIIETMNRIPFSGFLLILFMSIASALLVNHILKAGFYTTLAAIPVLLFTGVLSYAVLTVHGILLVPDRASNTALSAAFGFIFFATFSFLALRLLNRIRDKR